MSEVQRREIAVEIIPDELKQGRQWLCWRLEWVKERWTKVPYRPFGPLRKARSNDPGTWGTLEQALRYWQNHPDLTGIGIAFADDLVGIDLDNCIVQGRIQPWAGAIIERLRTYCEYSPSETGVHCLVRGSLPPGRRNVTLPHLGESCRIEMYDARSPRYFTVTGAAIGECRTVEPAQAALDELYAQYMRPRTPAAVLTSQQATLSDEAILAKVQQAANAAKFERLMRGDLSEYAGDHSKADLALCGILAFYTDDPGQIDRLFRRSALLRPKWDERHSSDNQTYGQLTIQKVLEPSRPRYGQSTGRSHHLPSQPPGDWRDAVGEPPPWLGEDGRDNGIPLPPAKTAPRKAARRRVTSSYLINYLMELGYEFRLNLCDDSVEVVGERISDVSRAQMRCQLRDDGLGKYLAAADDAVIASAASQPYHPVLDYLKSLTCDQQPHISRLAAHFADTNGVIGLYLRKWLIGAVARAYTGVQNAVLVLDGAQGLGKSRFVRWLCPLPRLFVDAYINPDDKDCALLAVRSWIWEVSELGATTRRADVEALKGFLSREIFTVRAPYGRFEIVKPGLASYIGTVNNAFGVFSDSTGSRRYWATTLTAIDWAYARNVDINQVWAEAHAAYLSGESWTLSPEEAQQAHGINESFAVPDPVEDLLRKYYQLDPEKEDKWLSSADILITLQDHGLGSNARANAMHLSATLKRLGHRKTLGGAKGKINGYVGIW